jgi:ABC-type uncharacterized transport system YnjBCD ATPase subunit
VVGESGCGKSSLMKTILGLYKPTRGRVIFDDQDLAELDSKGMHNYHSHVGYVQQDPYGALPPFMSVKQILEEPLIVGGVRSKEDRLQRVHNAMDEVKLTPVDDFLRKYPHMLSGGQQQRVVIARAMIMEPKFLVADEPVLMLTLRCGSRSKPLRRFAGITTCRDLHHARPIHGALLRTHLFVMYCGNLSKSPVPQLDNPLHPYTRPSYGHLRTRRAQCRDLQGDPHRRAAQPGKSADRLPIPPALPSIHEGHLRGEGTAGFRTGAGAPRGLLALRLQHGRRLVACPSPRQSLRPLRAADWHLICDPGR